MFEVPELLSKLKNFPQRYLDAAGEVNWELVYQDAGIPDEETLKSFLLYLAYTDTTVAYYVNRHALIRAMSQLTGVTVPPPDAPPQNRSKWREAEILCQSCPGSELITIGGNATSRCLSVTTVDKWNSCGKFRENLVNAKLIKTSFEDVVREFEDVLNDYTRETNKPGSVREDLESDRSNHSITPESGNIDSRNIRLGEIGKDSERDDVSRIVQENVRCVEICETSFQTNDNGSTSVDIPVSKQRTGIDTSCSTDNGEQSFIGGVSLSADGTRNKGTEEYFRSIGNSDRSIRDSRSGISDCSDIGIEVDSSRECDGASICGDSVVSGSLVVQTIKALLT